MTGAIRPLVLAAVLFSRGDFDESLTIPQLFNLPSNCPGSVFSCDRFALDPETSRRHFDELEPTLVNLIKEVQELPDGYGFQFPSDPKTITSVAEWAAVERVCCPFLDIRLCLERDRGPFWLKLTGREGTKEFIKVQEASWLQRAREPSAIE